MNPITIKLVFDLATDREKHELYELHKKYRLTPSEIKDAVAFLSEKKVIDHNGRFFRLSEHLTGRQLSVIYNAIVARSLELDKLEIQKIIDKAKPITELYKPNLEIIDETLRLD
jgi:hypothetical protein